MTASTQRLPPAAKLCILLFLAGYGIVNISNPDRFRLLDNVNLAIHEAGHLFFSPFGEFMAFLGGTLFQLIVPLTFFGYFLYQRDRFAAAVLLWWVAQNLWNISVYVKDAQYQVLPLVGGGEHDWAYLLGKLGVITKEQEIGQAIFTTGVLVFCASILAGIHTTFASPTDPPERTLRVATGADPA